MRILAITLSGFLLIGLFSTVLANDDPNLSESFKQLSRDTEWKQVKQLDLDFNIHHPQGMTKIDDRYYISSVEIVEKPVKDESSKNGYDRTPGKGVGHLFVVNEEGQMIKDIELGRGDMYHPGGIDFDGKHIWIPVAEYRPDSQSIIYKMNPDTLQVDKAFEVEDHIGGIVSDHSTRKLHGVSWGSRTFYKWNQKGKQQSVNKNPSHFIDYQDCESVGNRKMLCSGLAELPTSNGDKSELGGLSLIDLKTNNIEHEIPVTKFSPEKHVITRNPVFLEQSEKGFRLFSVPDDNHTSLFIYEKQ
ncbi:DUF6454 family protein [Pseudalkalibacillus berkeleyi]|uniref:DUF6454 family protein n=1 Tax=Pseudalkalibacillus berkeleyi TaxID=1069813 RepID=A0ABS9GXI2_9BACL|nr:DUF6454 family protein [Pseudalkalibacillus berkeleyi]MCF6136371.1 DUF6454 family protein [Pseudalkalibacillus berkeleyi]